MKFQHLLLPALALAISGCYDIGNKSIESKIQKQFSFLGNVGTLEYRLASDNLYMVKADNEIYFYSTADDAQFVIPAPKAFDINQNQYVDSLVNENKYAFSTLIKNSELKGIQQFAKVDPSLKSEEVAQPVGSVVPLESNPAPIRKDVTPGPAPTPPAPALALVTPTPLIAAEPVKSAPAPHQAPVVPISVKAQPDSDAAKVATDTAAAKSIAEGDARLSELKKQLQERFQAARKMTESALPNQAQLDSQSADSKKSMESVVTPPPKQLVKGDQFTYFNGTPVLKIDRNEDGSFASAEKKTENVKKMAAKIPLSWTINFPAIGEEKRQLFVFTDFTCPFCKRLHNDIPALNQAGITVRYLFYPRSYTVVPETPSGKIHMDMMRRAWCAPDQGEAMSELFDTKTIEDYKCETVPEAKGRINFPGPYHHFLGTVFNIEGTPTYFTNDGYIDAGYQGYESFLSNKLKK
jgi:protein-disulfide isomerase